MKIQSLFDLYSRGYRIRKIIRLPQSEKKSEPIGVGLFEKRGAFFQSIIYERFGRWIYATPEKIIRQ